MVLGATPTSEYVFACATGDAHQAWCATKSTCVLAPMQAPSDPAQSLTDLALAGKYPAKPACGCGITSKTGSTGEALRLVLHAPAILYLVPAYYGGLDLASALVQPVLSGVRATQTGAPPPLAAWFATALPPAAWQGGDRAWSSAAGATRGRRPETGLVAAARAIYEGTWARGYQSADA